MKFVESKLDLNTHNEELAKLVGAQEAAKQLELLSKQRVFVNDLYQINTEEVEALGCSALWLSVKRKDKRPIRDWRTLQDIKSTFLGPHSEALEVLPCERRVQDTANQYHLFAFKHATPFPVPSNFSQGLTYKKARLVEIGDGGITGAPDIVMATIHLTKQEQRGGWPALQHLKNKMFSEEHDGLRLYPNKERDYGDPAYALIYVLKDPSFCWPVGFDIGAAREYQQELLRKAGGAQNEWLSPKVERNRRKRLRKKGS